MPSQPDPLDTLADASRDLTASLTAHDRYARLLEAVRRVIPCDAACLLALDGDVLVPLSSHGLIERAMQLRYVRGQHPRLDRILENSGPIQFPADSTLPDPFDGLLVADPQALRGIHACFGAALHDGNVVVGALTADALERHAFDRLDSRLLRLLVGLAGAALRTARLIEALETTVDRQAQDLRDRARASYQSGFLGVSLAARRVIEELRMVSATHLPVLIVGETGVGKELVAAQLHATSPRRDHPLVVVNCAALPESLAESELFGHKKGAFSGAIQDRAGKFELADKATLFLDEVGELPLSLQPKLLRALQQGEVQRVGADRLHHVDVRVVAATNRDLATEVATGRFRADLYHRLATYPIRVPPLRERLDDIAILADHLLNQLQRRLGGPTPILLVNTLELLRGYPWPGNVRELENVLTRGVLRARAEHRDEWRVEILPRHVSPDLNLPVSLEEGTPTLYTGQVYQGTLTEQLDAQRKRIITEAVAAAQGNWAAAARSLGMHRSNLHALATRLKLKER